LPKREYLRRYRLGRTVRERVAGIDLVVLPEVFNPVMFRTGKYFAELLQRAELPGVVDLGAAPLALDVGTGSGVLALAAARRGYIVDAVDLNPEAVTCARANVDNNGLGLSVTVHHGDLFAPVAGKQYDLITFSPPSFRGKPASNFELCWRSTDIFERFADELPVVLKRDGLAMVLQTSHGDEIGLVNALLNTGLDVEVLHRKHFGVEILSVYGVRHSRTTR
jgi:methylase of polypeptide subunit release factors